MPRETFQQELDNLVDEVIELGTQVESSLESMVKAMESREAHLAEKELGVDVRYKGRGDRARVHDPAGSPGACSARPEASVHRAVCDQPPCALWHSNRAHLPRHS